MVRWLRCALLAWMLVLSGTAFADDEAPAEGSVNVGFQGVPGAGLQSTSSVDTSMGIATASFPFVLPPGRGGVGPTLSLSYAHTRGVDIAGVGWTLDLPSVELRGVAGAPPRFDDSDSYVFAGQRLTYACTAPCSTEPGPTWAAGWNVYRPQFERAPLRLFVTRDAKTWRLLLPDGGFYEFGVPLGTSNVDALDVDR